MRYFQDSNCETEEKYMQWEYWTLHSMKPAALRDMRKYQTVRVASDPYSRLRVKRKSITYNLYKYFC